MVRRQIALMGRSARHLGKHPEAGRELGRLIRTGGRSTLALRLPWLPFRLIDELEQVVGPRTRVFEYGGGGSTLWFLDRGASVVTVEHDEAWADALRTLMPPGPWELLERSSGDSFAEYVSAIDAYADDSFDLVVVDGRERARCLLAATGKVRPGGRLILDDTDRARYADALSSIAWPRREFVGFAPAKPSLAYTTVLTRPES